MTIAAAVLLATLLGLLGVGYAVGPALFGKAAVAPDAETQEEPGPGAEAAKQAQALRAWAYATGEMGGKSFRNLGGDDPPTSHGR